MRERGRERGEREGIEKSVISRMVYMYMNTYTPITLAGVHYMYMYTCGPTHRVCRYKGTHCFKDSSDEKDLVNSVTSWEV